MPRTEVSPALLARDLVTLAVDLRRRAAKTRDAELVAIAQKIVWFAVFLLEEIKD